MNAESLPNVKECNGLLTLIDKWFSKDPANLQVREGVFLYMFRYHPQRRSVLLSRRIVGAFAPYYM